MKICSLPVVIWSQFAVVEIRASTGMNAVSRRLSYWEPWASIHVLVAPVKMFEAVTSVPIDQIISDNQEELHAKIDDWQRDKATLTACRSDPENDCGSSPVERVSFYRIDIDFDLVADTDDPTARHRLKNIATSWTLTRREIDELRDIGKSLLRQAEDFQRLIDDLSQADPSS